MNSLLMNLQKGLIAPHTRVTFEIQFMLRSQQLRLLRFIYHMVTLQGLAG